MVVLGFVTQVAERIGACQLVGLWSNGSVWLAVSEVVAEILNSFVIGTKEGGGKTAQDTAMQLGISEVSKICIIHCGIGEKLRSCSITVH